MSMAWLSLGANIGDPETQIEMAISRLDAAPGLRVVAKASMMATKAWGKTDQPDFLNTALAVETILAPQELLMLCLAIENALGRKRAERWGPRLIDIDIIAYERIEIDEDGLTLPHPHAHERAFVLDPLREIAPDVANWIVRRTQ